MFEVAACLHYGVVARNIRFLLVDPLRDTGSGLGNWVMRFADPLTSLTMASPV